MTDHSPIDMHGVEVCTECRQVWPCDQQPARSRPGPLHTCPNCDYQFTDDEGLDYDLLSEHQYEEDLAEWVAENAKPDVDTTAYPLSDEEYEELLAWAVKYPLSDVRYYTESDEEPEERPGKGHYFLG